jgi:diaminopimelate epimerase
VGNDVERRTTTTTKESVPSVPGCAEQLARFFPEVERVQVRAVLTPLRNSPGTVRETVLLEFASQEKAIFGTTLPLEFEDRVRLKHADGSGALAARVVAVQYHEGQKAVAVQFVSGQRAWVKKP